MIDLDEIERIANAGDAYGHVTTCATVLALIAEVRALRETIKRQGSAARAGMDAAKRAATILYAEADKARAESSPDVLASERQANAMLTAENDALREDAERYQWLRDKARMTDYDGGNYGVWDIRGIDAYSNWIKAPYNHKTFEGAVDFARGAK